MLNKALVGDSTVGGGLILGPGAPDVICNGFVVSCIGDVVAPHAPFTGAHLAAVIVTASPDVIADGRPVTRLGDVASCGHVVVNGSVDVYLDS